MDKQVRYLPDLTAKNLNNKVEKERHHLKRQIKNRIIVPIYGCFYKEKLIVKDVFNKNILKHSVDYFLGGYRPNYSKLADGEIYSFIIINNDKVSESVEISYQAYGSVKADDSTITAQLLEDAFSSYDIVPFNKLKNLPKEYNPSLHYHDIGDIKEFQLLLFYLDQIRFCILADNKELFSYLAKIEKIIEAIINRALNSYDYLVFQKLRKYYEDFSLAMFGLDKVKNYPLMNFEDGFSIGDMTHPKMYSSLGEKYFSLKALEGFSKGLYSVYVNTEQTNLGYYKEKTVVPTISFLESMPIGASVTIPRLDSVELNQEIEKLYPDLEVKDCRYLVKKVASKNNNNKNSCYIYIHRDTGRTYVMVGFLLNNEYKTIFYKIASSLDGDVIINSIDKHILDYDNPHLDDKRDVNLSKVENLPIATKEDIICNMPVRKYITLRNLLLFMKRFKTGTKNVTEIHEQLSPRSETRLMQTIFSACGSWKNIDPNKIELCRVIQKEEDPWIYISESTTQMWEGDEILIFTISCSDHYVNKTFVYKLVLDSTTIFTDVLTIPLTQALDENFAQEFERWTREVSIPDEEGMTQEELIFKTFVKTFITLSSNSTQVIFRTNFRENPVFRGIELYENGSEVPEIVPVKKDPIKVKFNLYNFDEASDSIKDLIANSNHVTIKPDPSALEILINKQDGGLLVCFFKIITDNFSTDWMSGNEFDWHLSKGRFKFLPTDPLGESSELFLENGLFVNLANFRDDASGSKQTDKVKIEIRAAWVYNGGWEEEEGSIDYGTLPLKIKVRSTTGGYKNMDLLTTIQELNRTTPVVDVGESEPMTLNADNVNENTKAICRVEYDMQTRLIEIINYSDQTTSTTTTTTTTTTTEAPLEPFEVYLITNNRKTKLSFSDSITLRVDCKNVPSIGYKVKACLYLEDKVTKVKDTELKNAFINIDEVEDRIISLDSAPYCSFDTTFKSAYLIDNKFLGTIFYLGIEEIETGKLFIDYLYDFFQLDNFAAPNLFGLAKEQRFVNDGVAFQPGLYIKQDANTHYHVEGPKDYCRQSYGDPFIDPPDDDTMYDFINNQQNLNKSFKAVVYQENEDLPVTLHFKIHNLTSNHSTPHNKRNLILEDFSLCFFRDLKNKAYGAPTNHQAYYNEEIFLPYKVNLEKDILAIQVKSSDFLPMWDKKDYDGWFNLQNSWSSDYSVKGMHGEKIFVMICYGNPRRKVGYFKLAYSETYVNFKSEKDILVARYFETQEFYNFNTLTTKSQLIPKLNNSEPIFNSSQRRKYRPRSYIVDEKAPQKNYSLDFSPAIIDDPYLTIESIYLNLFTDPIESLEVSFYEYTEDTLAIADVSCPIINVHSPLYKKWLTIRNPINPKFSYDLEDYSGDGVDDNKKITFKLRNWISPPTQSYHKENTFCEVKINNYWIFILIIQASKSNIIVEGMPKNFKQTLRVYSIENREAYAFL